MRNTIKKHADFAEPENSRTFKCELFIARAHPTKFPGDARYGLIVPKRAFKLATRRNRIKRQLRVWIRLNEKLLLPDMDYVFIARFGIADADHQKGMLWMKRTLKEISKTKEQRTEDTSLTATNP